MKHRSEFRRYAILTYFVLAFAISWVGTLALGAPKFVRGVPMQSEDLWLIGIAMLLTPSILGIGLTALLAGTVGLGELFSMSKRPPVNRIWYIAPLIFPFLILIVQTLLALLVSPDYAPTFYAAGIVIGIVAGFLEEIGWMGFAFPRMRTKSSALKAAILLGVLHVLWHLVADYVGAYHARGAYWLPRFLAFGAAMVAMRIILVWVFVNTRSLLMAQLMHASSTGFLSILVSLSLSPAQDTLFYLIYAVPLWITAFAIIARYGIQLDGTKVTDTGFEANAA